MMVFVLAARSSCHAGTLLPPPRGRSDIFPQGSGEAEVSPRGSVEAETSSRGSVGGEWLLRGRRRWGRLLVGRLRLPWIVLVLTSLDFYLLTTALGVLVTFTPSPPELQLGAGHGGLLQARN